MIHGNRIGIQLSGQLTGAVVTDNIVRDNTENGIEAFAGPSAIDSRTTS